MTTPSTSATLDQTSQALATVSTLGNYAWPAAMVLWIGGIVCAFCLIFFLVSSFIVLRSGEGLSARYFKLTTLTLIAGLAALLTAVGYSAEQSNAALGLLGTLAGYLLGKGEQRKTQPKIDA